MQLSWCIRCRALQQQTLNIAQGFSHFTKKTTLSIIVNEANKTLKLNEEKIFPVEQETI